MKQERMKILTMVEDGTLTVDDATRLLEVLATTSNDDPLIDFQDKLSKLEAFNKELGLKISTTYKDMEPKVKTTTRNVVEKAATLVDDISKSIHDSLKKMKAEEDAPCCVDEECSCCSIEKNDDVPHNN